MPDSPIYVHQVGGLWRVDYDEGTENFHRTKEEALANARDIAATEKREVIEGVRPDLSS